MRTVNPLVIPRNHLVEAALSAAVERQDYAPFEALLDAVTHPFELRVGGARYAEPPEDDRSGYRTFCGT
jgi:uncharacterized protein YdiU (UPF0061 family)